MCVKTEITNHQSFLRFTCSFDKLYVAVCEALCMQRVRLEEWGNIMLYIIDLMSDVCV